MPDLITSFASDMTSRNLSPDTIRGYTRLLRTFERYLAGRPLEAVTRSDLKGYIDLLRSKNLSHGSASSHFIALMGFYDFLVFEEIIDINPVAAVRKRYLQAYKTNPGHTHQIVSVQDAASLVSSMVDIRDKAMCLLLFKTGVRVKELASLEVGDIDLDKMSITLKPTPKRTNRIVFFDEEAADALERWLAVRSYRAGPEDRQLWLGSQKGLTKNAIARIIRNAAKRIGLHDSSSPNMEDHFSPHCCRHFFTTQLYKAGMSREHIMWLRGDAPLSAFDGYLHLNPEDVRRAYLAHVPQLGL